MILRTLRRRLEPTYDVRTRPNLIEISSVSKDLQKVKIGLCVLARPGENFDERALLLIFNETMKTVVSQYNASQILTTERETVIKEIKDKLTESAMNFKIVLDDVSITISLLAAVGPEYTLFVDEKIEKDNTSAIIRAQDGEVEQTKEDMQQLEELEQREGKLEQWEGIRGSWSTGRKMWNSGKRTWNSGKRTWNSGRRLRCRETKDSMIGGCGSWSGRVT